MIFLHRIESPASILAGLSFVKSMGKQRGCYRQAC